MGGLMSNKEMKNVSEATINGETRILLWSQMTRQFWLTDSSITNLHSTGAFDPAYA